MSVSAADGSSGNPAPAPTAMRDFAFHYDGYRAGRLLIQSCRSCGALRHPPGPMCPRCNSLEWTAEPMSGRGVIYSYTVQHYPSVTRSGAPHPIVLADMEEGFRFVAAVQIEDLGQLTVGLPVQLEFPPSANGDLPLPIFRLRR